MHVCHTLGHPSLYGVCMCTDKEAQSHATKYNCCVVDTEVPQYTDGEGESLAYVMVQTWHDKCVYSSIKQ